MKRYTQIIALVMAALLLLTCMTGCSNAGSQIVDTLKEFEYACRNLDTDAILGCIAPDVANPIRMVLALYSEFTEQDYEDVTDTILEEIVYRVFGEGYDPDEFLYTLAITDVETEVHEDAALISCIIHFEIAGEQFERDSEIYMVEERGMWYIAYIDLFA